MSFGETLARWALIVGFSLLAGVTALAAAMIVITKQPGNVVVLSLVAVGSTAIAFYLRRTTKRTP